MLFTAFITGLFGSFHCAGMCGPIALATPTLGNTFTQKLISKIIYNSGRIGMYALLGLILGLFGFGLKLAGWQQSISIIAGAIIILTVVFQYSKIHSRSILPFNRFHGTVMGKLFQQKTPTSLFALGLLNGLLPCGFVYIALIGAVATQQAVLGALWMVAFGLGTFPMMIGIGMAGQLMQGTTRQKITKLSPVFALIIGCLFILRGLNLGIPYVSPKVNTTQTTVQACCKPQVK
jgi:hypothetical protein